MAPKDMILVGAGVSVVFAGAIRVLDYQATNAMVQSETQKQSLIQARSQNASESYVKYLEIVAREAMVGKLTCVTFDDKGDLFRIKCDGKALSGRVHQFKPGYKLSTDLSGNATTGFFDPYSNGYAAGAKLDGEYQIVHYFSQQEMKNEISRLKNKGANQ